MPSLGIRARTFASLGRGPRLVFTSSIQSPSGPRSAGPAPLGRQRCWRQCDLPNASWPRWHWRPVVRLRHVRRPRQHLTPPPSGCFLGLFYSSCPSAQTSSPSSPAARDSRPMPCCRQHDGRPTPKSKSIATVFSYETPNPTPNPKRRSWESRGYTASAVAHALRTLLLTSTSNLLKLRTSTSHFASSYPCCC